MSKVEELEQVIENLPPEDFELLSVWMARHRAILRKSGAEGPVAFRDHGAFLNGYSAEDEGLYDSGMGGFLTEQASP